MPNLKQKGFGLIGLIITVVIIAALVFGWQKLGGGTSRQNQIEQGQDAIDQAKKVKEQENTNEIYLQNEINSSADVNYHGVIDKLK